MVLGKPSNNGFRQKIDSKINSKLTGNVNISDNLDTSPKNTKIDSSYGY